MPEAGRHSIQFFREDDAEQLLTIARTAILSIGPRAYSCDQIAVWAAWLSNAQRYCLRASQGDIILVAVDAGSRPCGYALLQQDGHLDHLYIAPDHTRSGLGDRLLADAERHARQIGSQRLCTEASDLAYPAFERAGYSVTHRRDFAIDGVAIHNWAMEKALTSTGHAPSAQQPVK